MRICDKIKPENQTIKWLKDEFMEGNLYVDNSFQRRYVWLRKHQIQLIETILLGYVIPEIYIWGETTDPETGNTKYSIVDGQQRIGAIVGFINDEFPLSKAYLSRDEASYAGKKFSELQPDQKKCIWNYSISIRRIMPEVSRNDIVTIFLRLNSTNKSLNPQELRNAEFNGLFLQNAIAVSELDFWKKYSVFGSDEIRRMGDVDFASSLLIFLRRGIANELTQEAINHAYDYYNTEYEEANEDKEMISKILDCLEKVSLRDSDSVIKTYFRKTTHLYTMILAIYKYVRDEKTMDRRQMDNLIKFYRGYENSNDEYAEKYRQLLKEGTRSKQNRILRVSILRDVIEGKKPEQCGSRGVSISVNRM